MPYVKQLGVKYYWGSEIIGWPLSSHTGANFKKNKGIIVNKIKN
jgi:hypothetical protein